METRRLVPISVVLVIIALALGVSLGYGLAPQKTSVSTLTQTISYAYTQVIYSTTTKNQTTFVYPNYYVMTVTVKQVLVVVYTPSCVTVSGHVMTTYVSGPGMQTTTVTYIYPSGVPKSIVSITTVFNSTNTFSDRTQSANISC